MILTEEQSGVTSSFERRKKMQKQYAVLGCRVNLLFMTLTLQQNLMKMVTATEILTMKKKDKRQYSENFLVSLLELILTKT